jgi:Fe-S cluster assembly protein SufD
MSAPAFIERLQADFVASEAGLPAAVLAPEQRRTALDQLLALGLPALRDDAWRYANLRPVQAATLRPAANDPVQSASATGAVQALLAAAARPNSDSPTTRLVFVDGRLDATLSTLAVAGGALEPWSPATPARSAETRFALLNDIFALDAARFRVTGECVLEAIFIASDDSGAASYPRVQLELAAGAQLTLIERHLGGSALTSAVTELTLGRDSNCRFYRVQDLALGATHIDALQARLEAGAQLEAVLLQLGGNAVRSTVDCDLVGRGASVQLHAVSIADAARTLDSTLKVRHAAADTTSQQELRAIASERGAIAFQSWVSMNDAAPGADSRQSLKGLIGGPAGGTAEINLRPQLEIEIDSVRASHGATTGAIDEGMLFYLLSRGLDHETARQLLEWAFIETVIGRIALPAVRREFERRTVAHLGNRAALEVLA